MHPFVRHRSVVSGMRIVAPGQKSEPWDGTLQEAAEWLRGRGFHVGDHGDHLRISQDGRAEYLNVGQWLVHSANFRDVAVMDADRFAVEHSTMVTVGIPEDVA